MLETTVARELIEGLLGGNFRTRMEEIDYHLLAGIYYDRREENFLASLSDQ